MRGCISAKTEEVIKVCCVIGSGTENDPVREVVQYWSLDGELLFEKDSCTTSEVSSDRN